MTKTEAHIVRDMFDCGYYIAHTQTEAEKAWEVFKQVIPHRFEVIDDTDMMGSFWMIFKRIGG